MEHYLIIADANLKLTIPNFDIYIQKSSYFSVSFLPSSNSLEQVLQ